MFIWMADLVSSHHSQQSEFSYLLQIHYRFTSDTWLSANVWDTLHSYGSSHSESVFFTLGFQPLPPGVYFPQEGEMVLQPLNRYVTLDVASPWCGLTFPIIIPLWRLYCFPSNPVPVTRVAMGSENVYMGAFDVWNDHFCQSKFGSHAYALLSVRRFRWTYWWW